jgi:hypothetical protein
MEQSPWEANEHSPSPDITRLLWNPKIHYCVHTRACHWSLSGCIQSTSSHFTCLSSILILFPPLRLGLRSGLFPTGSPIKMLSAFLMSPMNATFHAISFLDMLTVITFGVAYSL